MIYRRKFIFTWIFLEMDCSASELDELICNKITELKRLNHEHKVLLKSRSCIPNSETESLNSELYSLMAEVGYLKESEPEIMPKHDAFLYDWAQHCLEEDIRQKENILFNLDKMHEESSTKRNSLIRKHPEINHKMASTKKMMEDAGSKNELLHCLHRKMVRRLRRLSRRFSTHPKRKNKMKTSSRDITGNVLKRSFYRVLKEFVVELQDRTFASDNWDKSEIVFIDETYCKEHIRILCNANIIRKHKRDPPSYYLIKPTLV